VFRYFDRHSARQVAVKVMLTANADAFALMRLELANMYALRSFDRALVSIE
jgi:hypothetical protein